MSISTIDTKLSSIDTDGFVSSNEHIFRSTEYYYLKVVVMGIYLVIIYPQIDGFWNPINCSITPNL